jgi:6-bladed beta-propeller protein
MPNPYRPPWVLAGLLALHTVSCDEPAPPSTVTVVDSAGVRIVTSELPAWEADLGGGWSVEEAPAIEIPGDFGDPDHYLFGAYYLNRMEDGRLVIGNRGSRQLLVFDSVGTFVRPIGQPGQGPGEFESVFGLFACAGDTLIIDEGARISVWDSALNFVRNERTSGRLVDGRANIRAVSGDCSAGLFPNQVYETPSAGQGVLRLPTSLHWATLDGASRDTVVEFEGVETYPWTMNGQLVATRLPFGKETTWTTHDDLLYLGTEDSYEVEVRDRVGRLVNIVRWGANRQSVTAEDVDYFEEGRRRYLANYPEEERLYAPLEHFPLPEFKPAYSRLLVDDEGYLWIQAYGRYNPFEPDTERAWAVFDTDGGWLGQVEMPEGLDVRAIQDGFVIGLHLDDFDVEHIRFHTIVRTSSVP